MTADTPWPPRRRDSNGGRWSTLANTLHRIDDAIEPDLNDPSAPAELAEIAELTAQLDAAGTPAEKFVAAEIRAAVRKTTGIDLTKLAARPCVCTPDACFAEPDDLADECLPCTQLDTCPARDEHDDESAENFRGYFTPPGADDHAATPIPGAQRHAPGLTGPPEGEGAGRLQRALRRIFS